ncbi:MAG: hypothetical protein ACI9XJ_001614 [Marivirga sp.]|jgi:hypothetical protein
MRTPLYLILLLFIIYEVNSQSIYQTIGAENIGIANCTANTENIWSGFHNSAGLASINSVEFSTHFNVFYGEIGLLSSAAAFVLPIKSGSIFLGISRFGNSIYNEHKLSLAYGSKIGIIQLGGRINYLQYQIQDFGSLKSYSIDLGVQAAITPQLSIGAYANNISRASLNKEQQVYIPSLLYMGLKYTPMPYFKFYLEVEKNLALKATFKSGVSYKLKNKWYFSSGIRIDSWESFYGTGFRFLKLNFNYAYQLHPILGSSHAVDLGFKL